MKRIEPLCRCGHDRFGHRIERPHPCKACSCAEWRRDFNRERRLREGGPVSAPNELDRLITPERAAEIRRAALRHAGGMLMVSLSEWEPQTYNPESARNNAEEELLREEVERIADELLARSLTGTRRPCSVCGFPYVVRQGGVVGRHHGVDAAGFSTGERCPGVGAPPRST